MGTKNKLALPLAVTISVIFICLSIFLFYKFYTLDRELKAINKEKPVSEPAKKAAVVKTSTDSEGRKHTTFDGEHNKVTKADLKSGTEVKATLDTVAMALDIQRKQIQEWQRIAITSQARALRAKEELDSIKKKSKYTYRNSWIQLGYEPGDYDTTSHSFKPGTFDYKYNVGLTHTQYNKRGRTLIDVFANDTNAVISGMDRYTIKPKPPYFNAKVKAESLYYTPRNELSSGAKLHLEFGKTTVSGGMYFNYMTGQWEQQYGVGLFLFKLKK